MIVYSCKKCGELNYLTPYAFWNISDFGAKCEKCEALKNLLKNTVASSFNVEQNIEGTMNVENQIDIKNLALVFPKIIYEPDQFPGAIFRTSHGPVCLIFSSGKVVIVGSKSEAQMLNCSNNIANILKKFWLT